jgi:sulfide:quinone oxidoreductase
VAADIAAHVKGGDPPPPYEGDGNCYVEFADGMVGKVDVNFLGGPAPAGRIVGPSRDLAAEKEAFGVTRRKRWFGLDTGRALEVDRASAGATTGASSRW